MPNDRLSDFEKTNRSHWDEVAELHARDSTTYRRKAFLAGEAILDPIVAGEIGPVSGLRLLHLQCHFGLDTLALARLGARVLGIDFSPVGIRQARELSAESGVPGDFVECRLQDVPDHVEGPFDAVFTSWGAICWLDDLDRWAEVISWALKPGGTFYMAEGHPLAQALVEHPGDVANPIIVGHPMLTQDEPIVWDTSEDYADPNAKVTNTRTYDWNHDLGTIVSRLIEHGLQIEFLREHPVIPWQASKAMVKQDDYFYGFPAHLPPVPLSFSLRAHKA